LTPIEYLNQALVSYNILFFTLSTWQEQFKAQLPSNTKLSK
jgi:hypothetical protein